MQVLASDVRGLQEDVRRWAQQIRGSGWAWRRLGGLVKGIRPSQQWMHGLDGGVAGLLGLPRDLCAGEKGSGLVKNVGVRRSYRRRCWPGCAVRRLVGTHAGAWSGAHDQWAVLDG